MTNGLSFNDVHRGVPRCKGSYGHVTKGDRGDGHMTDQPDDDYPLPSLTGSTPSPTTPTTGDAAPATSTSSGVLLVQAFPSRRGTFFLPRDFVWSANAARYDGRLPLSRTCSNFAEKICP
jgi:hypothetical protein